MEVLNRPELDDQDEQPSANATRPAPGKGLLYRGKESKLGFFAGRFAFVMVGTMFTVMVLFSGFMIWVGVNEPYLQPYVVNDKLFQDKIYLQVDGEANYRELIMVTQPGQYDQREITQLPLGASFKIVFTPKQLEVPENYFVTFLDGPNMNQQIEGGYERQTKFLREQRFYTLTVTPTNGAWPEGRYVIDAPSGGMFGGRYYAYFTIGNPAK